MKRLRSKHICDVPSNFIICLVCQLINLPLTCDSLVVLFGNQDFWFNRVDTPLLTCQFYCQGQSLGLKYGG